jgi:Tfp pilus assembly ATPase PilU
MQTMEQALCELVLRGTITTEEALESSSYPDQLAGLLERSGSTQAGEQPLSASGLRLAGS